MNETKEMTHIAICGKCGDNVGLVDGESVIDQAVTELIKERVFQLDEIGRDLLIALEACKSQLFGITTAYGVAEEFEEALNNFQEVIVRARRIL